MLRHMTSFTTHCEGHVHQKIVQKDGLIVKLCLTLVLNKDAPFYSHYLASSLYLGTYLDEINGDSPCLIYILNAILFVYVDNVVLLSNLGACLQRLLNKLHEFCISSSLDID
jgi:hypothetical protein